MALPFNIARAAQKLIVPTPKNLEELQFLLEERLAAAEAYRNPHSDGPFAVLGTSAEFIRGGNSVLTGLIQVVKQMREAEGKPNV